MDSYPTTASIDGQCDRTLIWNYRNNTWTIRGQSPFWNGEMSPIQFDSAEPMVDLNEFFPLMTSTKTTAAGMEDPDVLGRYKYRYCQLLHVVHHTLAQPLSSALPIP